MLFLNHLVTNFNIHQWISLWCSNRDFLSPHWFHISKLNKCIYLFNQLFITVWAHRYIFYPLVQNKYYLYIFLHVVWASHPGTLPYYFVCSFLIIPSFCGCCLFLSPTGCSRLILYFTFSSQEGILTVFQGSFVLDIGKWYLETVILVLSIFTIIEVTSLFGSPQ